MQSTPRLLRHSLRSGPGSVNFNLSRPRYSLRTRFSEPRTSNHGLTPSLNPSPTCGFSVCLRCQFRAQPGIHSARETDGTRDEKIAAEKQTDEDGRPTTGPNTASEAPQNEPQSDSGRPKPPEPEPDTHGQAKGRLPSSVEGRRSQWAKQFSSWMDTAQSNIFVAGQRLNDLTGYSSIEALKKEILNQGAPHTTSMQYHHRTAS